MLTQLSVTAMQTPLAAPGPQNVGSGGGGSHKSGGVSRGGQWSARRNSAQAAVAKMPPPVPLGHGNAPMAPSFAAADGPDFDAAPAVGKEAGGRVMRAASMPAADLVGASLAASSSLSSGSAVAASSSLYSG